MNDLATLEPVIRELTRESISENTRRTYKTALQKIDEWLAGMELTDALLAAYVSHLYQQGYASQSARVAMAAVSFRYRLRGEWSPAGPATRRVSVGYRRMAKGRGSKGRAKGIPWMDALRMARISEADGSLRGIRDAALIAIASDAMLRCSEMQAIQVSDITETAAGGTVYIAHSKTDPFGNGATLFLGEETVKRVKRWIEASWISDGPVFRGIKSKRGF